MPRRAVIAFFPVLAYRYPYVFFPTLPFTQGLRKVQAVFRSLEEEIPARGWEEQGSILTFTPC
ncbi:MAG: hypothetical protein HY520_03370 [Candidatus Aenigmarchaeota archaeon]|nr:hypothetical protein [Candidatus Aenigmarchaeota archaeon]